MDSKSPLAGYYSWNEYQSARRVIDIMEAKDHVGLYHLMTAENWLHSA